MLRQIWPLYLRDTWLFKYKQILKDKYNVKKNYNFNTCILSVLCFKLGPSLLLSNNKN